jgi:hypothetical protein
MNDGCTYSIDGCTRIQEGFSHKAFAQFAGAVEDRIHDVSGLVEALVFIFLLLLVVLVGIVHD